MDAFMSYQRYAQIRDAAGLKDVNVAEAIQASRSTFTNWKYGRTTPKIDKIKAISELLHVDLNVLIDTQEDEDLTANRTINLYYSLSDEDRALVDHMVDYLANRTNTEQN